MTDVNSVKLNKEKVAARAERQRVVSAQNAEQRAKQIIRERASRRVQICLGFPR